MEPDFLIRNSGYCSVQRPVDAVVHCRNPLASPSTLGLVEEQIYYRGSVPPTAPPQSLMRVSDYDPCELLDSDRPRSLEPPERYYRIRKRVTAWGQGRRTHAPALLAAARTASSCLLHSGLLSPLRARINAA